MLFCASSSLIDPSLAFRARAVVAEDVEDDGVVPHTQAFQFVDDSTDLDIDVFGEPGKNLHQPELKCPLGLGNAVSMRPSYRREP